MRPRANKLLIAFNALLMAGALSCAQGATPDLLPIRPATAEVNRALSIALTVGNGNAGNYSFSFEAPAVPKPNTALIAGSEFLWTPLAAHVGAWEFTFILKAGDGEVLDRETTLITVVAASEAAPRFALGAGGTYDLTRSGTVDFAIDVLDDDSAQVQIRARTELPTGAVLTQSGPKRAQFTWTPTPDQVGSKLYWPLTFEANDNDHPPVPHDYGIRLIREPKDNCPGLPPAVSITAPREGERITSASGFRVAVSVTDDHPLREAPVLHYSTTRPLSPADPDPALFTDVTFENEASSWRARIPSLDLEPGQERAIYIYATATDNDDSTGTACDHRIDTPVVSFTGVGSTNGPALATCDACTASVQCATATCVAGEGGARCLPKCDAATPCSRGTCIEQTTREGAPVQACGDTRAVCEGTNPTCRDDAYEPNNDSATAYVISNALSAQICSGDPDYYWIGVYADDRIDVRLSFTHATGDLDLHVKGADGTILETSYGQSDEEHITLCAEATGAIYAEVLGYEGAENAYTLDVTSTPGGCYCENDSREDDDTPATAVPPDGSYFDGTICEGDHDYVAVAITGTSTIEANIALGEGSGDLDLELLAPDGTVLAQSTSADSSEFVSTRPDASGTYLVHVYGYHDAQGTYLGTLAVTPEAP